MPVIEIKNNCNGCKACIDECPALIFELEKGKAVPMYEKNCIKCGHCISVCPIDAVIHHGLNPSEFLPVTKEMHIPSYKIYSFLRKRRSINTFKKEPVPEEILLTLVDIARFAPTQRNLQKYKFLIIKDEEKLERLKLIVMEYYRKLSKALEDPLKKRMTLLLEGEEESVNLEKMLPEFKNIIYLGEIGKKDYIFNNAPSIIIVYADTSDGYPVEDCSFATYNMMLMAESMNLSTCNLNFFKIAADNDTKIAKELGLTEKEKIFNAICVGYAKYPYRRLVSREKADVKVL